MPEVARPRLQVGGTVPLDCLYLSRPADEELPAALLRGELCYVLAPRQMGKSSLRLRAQRALEQQGVRCAAVDLTTVGGKTGDTASWYFSVIDGIGQGLGLPEAKLFWEARGPGTPVQSFVDYIRREVAARVGGPAVIFIDELDGLLALAHVSRDDFLAAVRALYNARADDPALRLVTFCLLGAVLPADLIEDEQLTPFNVGRGIVLGDFARSDLQPLEAALGARLDQVYAWTAGHPFMTMKLCESLLEADEDDEDGGDVAGCVRKLFLSGGRVKEVSLAYAERYFERKEGGARAALVDQMLWLYGRLLSGESVAARAQDPVQGSLGLSGLTAERGGQLAVRNRVFAEVFDGAWVKKQQAERLFAEPLRRWLEGGRRSEHLLRGADLESALAWAKDRGDVAAEEREFLLASQAAQGEEQVAEVARRAAEQEKAVLRTRNRVLLMALAVVLALLGLSVVLGLRAREAARREKVAAEQERAAAERERAAAKLAEQREGEAKEAERQEKLAKDTAKRDRDRAVYEKNNAETARAAAEQAIKEAQAEKLRAQEGEASEKGLRAVLLAGQPDRQFEALVTAISAAGTGWQGKRVLPLGAAEGLETAARTATYYHPIAAHSSWVRSVAYSPDGQSIITVNGDGTAMVWDVKTGKIRLTLQGNFGKVYSAAYAPDGQHIVTTISDHTARVWDVASGKAVLTLQGHPDGFSSAVYAPDGQYVVTAGSGGARIWDITTGQVVRTLQGPIYELSEAAFAPDGQHIVITTKKNTAMVWDVRTGTPVRTLQGHSASISSVAYSPDGRHIVTSSGTDGNAYDYTARVWDVSTGQAVLTLKGFINSAVYSPDGQYIVTSGCRGEVWDATTGTELQILNYPKNCLNSAAYAPDGQHIVTAGRNEAMVWDVGKGQAVLTLRGQSAVYAPDGLHIATIGLRGIEIWDVQTGKQVRSVELHMMHGKPPVVAYAPDGQHIAASGLGSTEILDVQTAKEVHMLGGGPGAYSPDGQHIVIAAYKEVMVHDVQSDKVIQTLQGHSDSVNSAIYSPDGQHIVTASTDKTARVWEVKTGKSVLTLRGHSDWVMSAAYAPDGKHIVTAGKDDTAKVWNAQTGKMVLTLQGHSGPVHSAAYAPDGQHIVTASQDKTARVWDASTGRAVLTLQGHTDSVNSAAYSPDGRHIVTASENGTAIIHPARQEDYFTIACNLLRYEKELDQVRDACEPYIGKWP